MSRAPTPENDAFYTPAWLAEDLANCLPIDLKGPVLDPTVGGGALLSAVRDRFGDSVVPLGIDIDAATVRRLRVAEPNWVLSCADLLSVSSRRSSLAWRTARVNLAAVVVNPPFSFRGNGGPIISYGGFEGRVAPSMRFLIELVRELSPTAGFFAILPDGALEAERHRDLWVEVGQDYAVSRLKGFKTTSFRGARVSTSLVHLEPVSPRAPRATEERPGTEPLALAMPRHGCRCIEVIRGRVPVHTVRNSPPVGPMVPFVHTKGLSRMNSTENFVAQSRLADEAPFVLLTRVGKWSAPVIVEIGRVVLSDCLFALRPRARSELERLRAEIKDSENSFRSLYKGTGARYLTLNALVQQLGDLGWHAHVVRASVSAGVCCCAPQATCDDSAENLEHNERTSRETGGGSAEVRARGSGGGSTTATAIVGGTSDA